MVYNFGNLILDLNNSARAKLYKNKSVAEQNSVDLAWDLLMEPKYQNLRRQIYSTEAEFKRFRQLVVNTVMVRSIVAEEFNTLYTWKKVSQSVGTIVVL